MTQLFSGCFYNKRHFKFLLISWFIAQTACIDISRWVNGEEPWLCAIFRPFISTGKGCDETIAIMMNQLVSRIIIVEDACCYINVELSNSFSYLICFEIPLRATVPVRLVLTQNLHCKHSVRFFRSRSQKLEMNWVCILLQAG